MEKWLEIAFYPDYSVSDYGRVRNDATKRIMTLTKNQNDIVTVGLMKHRRQCKLSVAKLVAETFIPPMDKLFDTPINLDGNRENNYLDNLEWRPRWFAVKYFHQFNDARYRRERYQYPIQEIYTRQRFMSSWDAAVQYGLLVNEVYLSTIDNTRVWPTYQKFERI